MRALDDLVRSGKARYVGLSNVPAWHAARAQTIAEARGWETVSALQLEYSLIERGIENEFVDLATRCGMGVMAWSPLAGGLLTGKYRPGESAVGRLETLKDSPNPAFRRLTPRNQAIIAELEAVAKAIGRPMAQVALNWVANRPGVASVIVGATTPAQLASNLAALSFSLPAELKQRLDAASAPPPAYPYLFFGETLQGMLHGGARVGDKPPGYFPTIESAGAGASGAA
jgi:aryl-alcohol dehydrogenase-like predicted oxidoreductase